MLKTQPEAWICGHRQTSNFYREEPFDELAKLLNMIEEGAEWPEQTKISRAAFLSKEENDLLNPLAYRVLLMLPYIYRLWGRARLEHL